jgi:hypothetical protein
MAQRLVVAVVCLTVLVVISTLLSIPSSPNWRSAIYVILGFLISWVATRSTDLNQVAMQQQTQEEIRKLFMQRVSSRSERTAAVISLCKDAESIFRAVTYFPVVGIQDNPKSAPSEYLNALESILKKEEVEVTLVSVSCAEAREFAIRRNFGQDSLNALEWAEERLRGLTRRYRNHLRIVTVPGSAITMNVCHNHKSALVYFMSPTEDNGKGFKSNDPVVLEVAEGGATRYASYRELERKRPLPGLKWRG